MGIKSDLLPGLQGEHTEGRGAEGLLELRNEGSR